MVAIHGQVAGLDGEVLLTALDAFRTPDGPEDPARSPEQRTADALIGVARAALDLGAAPSDRRVRPHVLVTVADDDLRDGTGSAEMPWTGPLPVEEIRRVTSDATIRVMGLDESGLPISLSKATDHPTAAQYLALAYRDGGCRYPGCDAPATWCDIAHATARRHDGRVHPGNTLLLCRRHHRYLDLGSWTITIDGWDATFTHPRGREVQAGPARGRPPDDP
jgi:hypothetical protein